MLMLSTLMLLADLKNNIKKNSDYLKKKTLLQTKLSGKYLLTN